MRPAWHTEKIKRCWQLLHLLLLIHLKFINLLEIIVG